MNKAVTTARPSIRRGAYQVHFYLVTGERSTATGRFTESEAVAKVAELRQRDDVTRALFNRA